MRSLELPPEDFANAVALVASAKARIITGSTLTVDGGVHQSIRWRPAALAELASPRRNNALSHRA